MKVSICMITYNHEKYIKEAIEGVLMQKTSFDFELVIGEDCSTDNTRNILIDYQKKYPNKIRLLLPEKNLGMMANFIATLKACSGQYIALCEGDDYWTDPKKLQRQVNEMESESNLSFTFHKVDVFSERENKVSYTSNQNHNQIYFTTADLIRRDWFIKTCSIMVQATALKFPGWFNEVWNGDYAVQLLCSLDGPGKFINLNMGVYRKQPNGVSMTVLTMEKGCHTLSFLLDEFNKYTNNKFDKEIKIKKTKLRTRLVEEFVYDIPRRKFYDKKYWSNYFKILKYSDLSNFLHWKYLIRFIIPIKPKVVN